VSDLPQKRMQELWFYVELGAVDGGGIGRWEETTESHRVNSFKAAEDMRDEWLVSGKIHKTHWGEFRPDSPYGAFRIRAEWEDVALEAQLAQRDAALKAADDLAQHAHDFTTATGFGVIGMADALAAYRKARGQDA
jgi:hypothetical protein